jgi:hypothetical protein
MINLLIERGRARRFYSHEVGERQCCIGMTKRRNRLVGNSPRMEVAGSLLSQSRKYLSNCVNYYSYDIVTIPANKISSANERPKYTRKKRHALYVTQTHQEGS